MPDVTIIFWRDIPAQVLVGAGRRALKQELPERFQVAIDAAAMHSGARDSDAYLADWHKMPAGSPDGAPETILAGMVAEIDAAYDQPRLKALIANGGKSDA